MAAIKDVSDPQGVVMTSHALDLLTCFQDGFDEVVAQLAEVHARKRAALSGEGQVQVTVDDVRTAGNDLIGVVRSLVKQGDLPPEIESSIQDMNECLECNQQ